jgi:hypothetical protein
MVSKQDKLTALDDGPLRLRFLPRDCLQHENGLILVLYTFPPPSHYLSPSPHQSLHVLTDSDSDRSISSPPTHLKPPDMERLSLNESPASAQRNPQQQQQQFSQQNALGPASSQERGGPPQLPPQMFTTAAQLLDLTDSMSIYKTWDLAWTRK